MGPPEVGEAVQVKWPDGLFYGAKYLGSNVSYMYQVHNNMYRGIWPSLSNSFSALVQSSTGVELVTRQNNQDFSDAVKVSGFMFEEVETECGTLEGRKMEGGAKVKN